MVLGGEPEEPEDRAPLGHVGDAGSTGREEPETSAAVVNAARAIEVYADGWATTSTRNCGPPNPKSKRGNPSRDAGAGHVPRIPFKGVCPANFGLALTSRLPDRWLANQNLR